MDLKQKIINALNYEWRLTKEESVFLIVKGDKIVTSNGECAFSTTKRANLALANIVGNSNDWGKLKKEYKVKTNSEVIQQVAGVEVISLEDYVDRVIDSMI